MAFFICCRSWRPFLNVVLNRSFLCQTIQKWCMRIAIFTDTFTPSINGIVVSVVNSISILSKKGNDYLVVCPQYGAIGHENLDAQVLRLPSLSLPQYKEFHVSLPFHRHLTKIVKEFAPDCVHIETYGTAGFLGARVAKKLKIPLMGTYHTLASEMDSYIVGPKNKLRDIKEKEGLLKQFLWKTSIIPYNFCDLVTAPAQSIVRALKKHELKPPTIAISNGIELSMFPMKKKYATKPRKIIHLGRISFEKRLDILLESFKLVLKEMSDVKLEVIGGGPALESSKELAKKLGIAKSVKFLGYKKRTEIYKRYQAADVFVTASPMETQGLVIYEAMACGLPCVGVNRYAVPDAIKNGKNGFVAKNPYVENMAKQVLMLLKDPQLIERLGRAGRKSAEENEIEKCVVKLGEAYKKTISLHKKKNHKKK